MRELGDQWIEIIDGQEHMLKAVDPVDLCQGCCFNRNQGGCCWKGFDDCQMGSFFIIKDLGILNDDGCLPSPWGDYPKIIHEVDQDRTESGEDVHYDNLWCVEIHKPVLICTDEYPTKQEAIGAWNRRV